MEYKEYVIQFMCCCFNRKWNFAQRYFILHSFRALASSKMLTAVTRLHVSYLPKMALQIVALNADISNLSFFKN